MREREREREVLLVVDIKNKHVVIKKFPITNTKLVSFYFLFFNKVKILL